MTAIVCISDTHGLHDQVDVPIGDILIHAGDCTNVGHPLEVAEFLVWFAALPHRHKVLIAGNHDFLFETEPDAAMALLRKYAPSVHYLNDSGVSIAGLKIWGSPVQPEYCDWAFNKNGVCSWLTLARGFLKVSKSILLARTAVVLIMANSP